MPDAKKVAEPPKGSDDEQLIDTQRSQIEEAVVTLNANPESPEPLDEPDDDQPSDDKKTDESSKHEDGKEDKASDDLKKEDLTDSKDDPIDKIKKAVQRRIDKVVAKRKSVEEELAETKAELERLKTAKVPEQQEQAGDPTPEQVESYIAKMQEEGNHKEAAAAIRYLVKIEKEHALKEVQETQSKSQAEAKAQESKTNAELKALANDYVVYDEKGQPDASADLTLANKNGKLFQVAMSLYNDPEFHKDFYFDHNVVNGFRRAVADAYREIHQQGMLNAPKGAEPNTDKRNLKAILADPDTDSAEEPSQSNSSALLSDADKVREEIRARKKNRIIRKPS